ncbi:MAG TPA: adenylate/guanylate cyclase domain-containing protein, partial [Methylomirabilota bacterium]
EPRHAHLACEAALAMREQTSRLSTEWAAIGRPRLRARTGINSGPMVVGNLGSKYRFAYGVVGDQVNLGSRLEGLNKEYRTDILVSENTVQLVGPEFLFRELDLVRVKGRQQTVRIYELIAKGGTPLSPEHQRVLGLYAEGLELYRKGLWTEALGQFREVLAMRPEDGPSWTLAQRCMAYEEAPPEDWDGVFEQLYK